MRGDLGEKKCKLKAECLEDGKGMSEKRIVGGVSW